jgi:hypothetical protein
MLFQTLFLMPWFRRDSQFVTAFSSSASENFSTVSRSHPVHKTVLVPSFSFRWLKRSFAHCFVSLKMVSINSFLVLDIVIQKPSANIQRLFFLASSFIKIFLIPFTIFAITNLH